MRRVSILVLGILAFACDSGDDPAASSDGTEGSGASTSAGPGTMATSSPTGDPTGPAPEGDADVIDLGAFVLVGADEPFADRPAVDDCELGFGLEDGLFEVDAELCLYGAFAQPSLAEIRAGDSLEAVIVHDALYSEKPGAAAHIGIAVGSEIAWEQTIDIPADNGVLRPQWTAATDAPAGTPIHYHLHNHGVNTYRLVALKVTYN